tara:strand:+ start:21 stop:509 length:489 start_codon:yes stop_codon:yes gene_type:complete
MKYVKKLILERYLSGDKLKGKVYHAASKPINKLNTNPIWFALEKTHSDKGWFTNIIDNGSDEAYQYEGNVIGKVGDLADSDVVEILNSVGVEPFEWSADMASNPGAKEVLQNKGTKALMKAGYVGIIYYDYDPRNFQAGLQAIIVFNPLKSVKGWKLIKQYP